MLLAEEPRGLFSADDDHPVCAPDQDTGCPEDGSLTNKLSKAAKKRNRKAALAHCRAEQQADKVNLRAMAVLDRLSLRHLLHEEDDEEDTDLEKQWIKFQALRLCREEFLGLLSVHDVEWPLIKYQVAELMG